MPLRSIPTLHSSLHTTAAFLAQRFTKIGWTLGRHAQYTAPVLSMLSIVISDR